ncbi:site-specific integrase [Thermodesulfovibrio sp. 3462-1]
MGHGRRRDLEACKEVKFLQENNRRLRFLSKEECQTLINACDPHLRPIVICALNTGMRKSEFLNLKWDQVDLKHGFIFLDKTKNGERREIPINDTLRITFNGLLRRLDTPYVFYDPATGKPYQDVKRSFASACRRAKIQDFRFHDLRHTFASHLVMAGVDLTTVKELLGHKTLTMTLRYSHLHQAIKLKRWMCWIVCSDKNQLHKKCTIWRFSQMHKVCKLLKLFIMELRGVEPPTS